MHRIPPGDIRSVTIPGGGVCNPGGDVAEFFADFRDDAILQSH